MNPWADGDMVAAAAWQATRRGFALFAVDHPSLPSCAGVRTREHDPSTCTERGKHPCPLHWSAASSADVMTLAADLTGATRNLGVDCGKSGLLVLDEDAPGEFARYAASVGEGVPETFTVLSARGPHFYLAQPSQPLGNAEGGLRGYGVNVRGAGGYVVAAGSQHASGVVYTVVDPGAELAPCPLWLEDALRQRSNGDGIRPGSLPDVIRGPRTDSPGERHGRLVEYAGWLRGRGIDVADAEQLFRLAWERCEQPPVCTKPLGWDEALAKLHSVFDLYPVNPFPGILPSVEANADLLTLTGELVEPGLEAALQRERLVNIELERLRIRAEAKRAFDAETRGRIEPPEVLSLRERLLRPRPPKQWRINGWQPASSRVIVAAQYKAGKTTLTGNLSRCLVDGDLWLGKHDVATVTGAVVILDFEMSADQVEDWLRDQRITNDDRIVVVPMRGKAAAFDILDERVLSHWVDVLRGAEYVILDCLRPIMDALGLDEHHDAGRLLVPFDALLDRAGVPDALVVHHMGHGGERSRGDSRIRDWPDVEWRLVREDDEPASKRYISAFGRDVDIAESQLVFNPATRHLTLAGGSRKDAAASAALSEVLDVLEAADSPLNGGDIEKAFRLSDHSRDAVRKAVQIGVRLEQIASKPGPGTAVLYSSARFSYRMNRPDFGSPADQNG